MFVLLAKTSLRVFLSSLFFFVMLLLLIIHLRVPHFLFLHSGCFHPAESCVCLLYYSLCQYYHGTECCLCLIDQ